GAVYSAGHEQLPDTSKDWYSIQHAVAVSGGGASVLWASRDAPLVQLGGFHTGQWARELEAPRGMVNSWLMNNLHFTNFQARQEINRTFRYRFLPWAAPATAAQVARFGRDAGLPLQARATRSPVSWTEPAGLAVHSSGDLLAEVRPVSDGVRVRLREIAGADTDAEVVTGTARHPVQVPAHGRSDVLIVTDRSR